MNEPNIKLDRSPETLAKLLSPNARRQNDGSDLNDWGADVASLCKLGYSYRGRGNWRYMAIMTDLETREKLPGTFHFTGNSTTFEAPTGITTELRVNRATPGLNLYYCPQTFKHQWIPPEQFYALPEEERYKYRTDKTEGEKYYGSCGFNAEDILAYKCLVIDIDNHEELAPWVGIAMDQLVEAIIEGAIGKKGVFYLRPSYVVKTGRGIQACYNIEPIYAGGEKLVRMLMTGLIDFWEYLLKDNVFQIQSHAITFEVDKGVSMNVGGYKRLPWSYNWNAWNFKTHKFGYLTNVVDIYGDSTYSVDQLIKLLKMGGHISDKNLAVHERCQAKKAEREQTDGKSNIETDAERPNHSKMEWNGRPAVSHAKKQAEKKPSDKNDTYKPYVPSNCGPRADRWLRAAHGLIGHIKEGCRNNFLFSVGCILLDGHKDAEPIIHTLNDELKAPLHDHELDHIVHEVNTGKYHFSNAGVINRTTLTAEDLAPYGITIDPGQGWIENAERARIRAEKRKIRDDEITVFLRKLGSIAATARCTHHCRATVRKVLARYRELIALIKERNQNNAVNLRRFITAVKRLVDAIKECIAEETNGQNTVEVIPLTS